MPIKKIFKIYFYFLDGPLLNNFKFVVIL